MDALVRSAFVHVDLVDGGAISGIGDVFLDIDDIGSMSMTSSGDMHVYTRPSR